MTGGEPDRRRPHEVVDAAHRCSPGCEFARQAAHLQVGHAGQHQVASDDVVAQEELLARQRLGEPLLAEGGDVGVQEGGVQTGAGLGGALAGGDPVPWAGERVGGQVDAAPGGALVQTPPVDVVAVQPGGRHGVEVAPVQGEEVARPGRRHLGGPDGGGAPGQERGELGAQGRGAVDDDREPAPGPSAECGRGPRPGRPGARGGRRAVPPSAGARHRRGPRARRPAGPRARRECPAWKVPPTRCALPLRRSRRS